MIKARHLNMYLRTFVINLIKTVYVWPIKIDKEKKNNRSILFWPRFHTFMLRSNSANMREITHICSKPIASREVTMLITANYFLIIIAKTCRYMLKKACRYNEGVHGL